MSDRAVGSSVPHTRRSVNILKSLDRAAALHRVVMPVVTAFADFRSGRSHSAHTDSRTAKLSRLYKGLSAIAGMPSRLPLRRRD
jgi:hypothetical protein